MVNKKAWFDKLHGIDRQQGNLEATYLEGENVKNKKKWMKYFDLCKEGNEYFVERCNNRTVLPCEILIDPDATMEEQKKVKKEVEKDKSIENKEEEIQKRIKKLIDERFHRILPMIKKDFQYYSVYKSGGKGYHISMFCNRNLSSEEKLEYIKKYEGDTQLASNRHMIALENCIHWRYVGKTDEKEHVKTLIEEKFGINVIPEKRTIPKNVLYHLKSEVSVLLAENKRRKATELIVGYIEGEFKFYTTRQDKPHNDMYIHDGEIFQSNGESFIREKVRDILGELFTTGLANEVIDKIQADTFVEEEWLFSQESKEWLPCNNGVLNVLTREFRPYKESDIFFYKIPTDYNPDAKCEKITKFLEEVLAHPDDKLVYCELVGRGLLKDNFIEKAGILTGKGRNGKTKTVLLAKKLVGESNCCDLPLQMMIDNSFYVHVIHKKMFNIVGDLGQTDLKDTGCFKKLMGRDGITAQRKFKTPLNFTSYAQNIFLANELPIVYDRSEGFWSKWVALDFPYKFKTQKEIDAMSEAEKENAKLIDQEIFDKISTPEEMSGFLNSCLDGLDRLRQNHDFTNSQGSKEIKEWWMRKSDSFAGFCMDCLQQDPENYIPKKDLRLIFSQYCKHFKLKGASDKAIKVRLEEEFGASEDRKMVLDEYVYVWMGVSLKPNVYSVYPFSTLYKIGKFLIGSKKVDTLDIKNKGILDYGIKTFKVLKESSFINPYEQEAKEILLKPGELHTSQEIGKEPEFVLKILLQDGIIEMVTGGIEHEKIN